MIFLAFLKPIINGKGFDFNQMEKLNKESLIFTTTNPENRYIRFTNVKETDNLRSFYYRVINLGGQEEEVYEKTEKARLARAFKTDQIK